MDFSFVSLLNTSISASWLVLVVVGLRFLLKKAPKAVHCALWALVAIRLLCPFTMESEFSLIPSTQTVSDYYLTQEGAMNSAPAVLDLVENPVYPEEVDITLDTKASRISWLDVEWSLFIWPAGMAVMAAYVLISYLRLRKKVSASIGIARNIRICDYINSPFILGIIRPNIYLPSNMDQNTIDHVLAHERAHLARKDHWWKPLGFALLTVHWFNPLMWLAYILLCRDIELACDEKVIKNLDAAQKKSYSSALLQCSVSRPMIAACPLAFGEVGVKERVKTVLNYKKPAFWMVVLAVILCGVVAVCFLTNPLSPDAWDIMYQEGYTVLAQCDQYFDITIPLDALPEEAFSEEGHTFDEKEVVVYQTDTTTIWLMNVQYANEGNDKMYFEFNVSHELPRVGTILVPSRVEVGTRISGSCFNVTSRTVTHKAGSYDDAVAIRASGPDLRFTVYIDTEAARNAQEYLSFPVFLNQLTYARQGAEPEIPKVVHPYDSNYKTWSFYSGDLYEYEVGINADDRIAFYDPYRAFVRMTEDYADAVAHIQRTFDLAPLSPLDYADYKTYGWQVNTTDDALLAACRAVTEFLDIYENSFTDAEDTADKSVLLAEGNYVSQKQRYWAWYSSYIPTSVTMEVNGNDISIFIDGSSDLEEGTVTTDWNWQAECPISEERRQSLDELSNIEPIFAMTERNCQYLVIDDTHFIVETGGELYLVAWEQSNVHLEIIQYVFHMVPEAEYTTDSGWIKLGYATLETDPQDEAIYRYFLEQYAMDSTDNINFHTSVSFKRYGEIYSQQDDESRIQLILAAVRVGQYSQNSDSTIVEESSELLPVRLSMTRHDDGTYEVTDCVRDERDYSASAFTLEAECWRQAFVHFNPDTEMDISGLITEYPEYFTRDTTYGLDLLWWDTPEGVRCVILSGLQRQRFGSEAGNHPLLTVPEAMVVLQSYDIPVHALFAPSSSTLALFHVEAP